MKEFLDKTGLLYFYNKIKPSNSLIQVDWNESNSNSKAYIANKPSVVIRSEMGEANGVATLDLNGHLNTEQLEGNYPNSIAGNVIGEFSDESLVSFRPTAGAVDVNSGKAGKGAKITCVKGNVVNWNQLLNFSSQTFTKNLYATVTKDNTNKTITVNCTAEENSGFYTRMPLIKGHKYVYMSTIKGEGGRILFGCTDIGGRQGIYPTETKERYSGIGVFDTDAELAVFVWYNRSNNACTLEVSEIMIFDLTLIYGAGNEPTTVEQFEADYQKWFGKPLTYEAYNAGELIPVKATGIKTVGFNQWDEEWELGGINESGEYVSGSSSIRCKNLVRLIPNTDYVLYYASYTATKNVVIFLYDADKNFTRKVDSQSAIKSFTTASNEQYLAFRSSGSVVVTTYNHDICINLSWSGYRNGEYEEYWTQTKNLPITTLTGKVGGEGESVVVFPDGMKKAGTVYDEIYRDANGVIHAVKRIEKIDLGTLTWGNGGTSDTGNKYRRNCNDIVNSVKKPDSNSIIANIVCTRYLTTSAIITYTMTEGVSIASVGTICIYDPSYNGYVDGEDNAFKTAMSGVILYYELAEPVDYILDDFELPLIYDADDYGTEEVLLGTNGCAPILNLKYGINAGDTIKNLPHNYVSAVGDLSFTAALKARARRNIGAISQGELESADFAKVWNGTQAEYDALTTYDSNTIYIIS